MIKSDKFFTQPLVVIALALVCSFLWGSAFPVIKIGYEAFSVSGTPSTLLFAGIRFTLAGVLVVAMGSLLKRKLLLPTRKSWGKLSLLSLAQTGAQYLFFYVGLAHCSGVKSSLLFAVNVFFAIFVSCFLFRQEKFTLVKAIGCLVGFGGILLINFKGLDVSFSLLGEGFVLLAALSSAVSSSLIKEYSKTEDPVMLCGYQFVLGGLLLAFVGFACGGRLTVWSARGVALLCYLALISSVAYTLWGLLLKYNKPSKITVFGFLNPSFGALLSAWWLRERVDPVPFTLALLLISLGIVILHAFGEKSLFAKKEG